MSGPSARPRASTQRFVFRPQDGLEARASGPATVGRRTAAVGPEDLHGVAAPAVIARVDDVALHHRRAGGEEQALAAQARAVRAQDEAGLGFLGFVHLVHSAVTKTGRAPAPRARRGLWRAGSC